MDRVNTSIILNTKPEVATRNWYFPTRFQRCHLRQFHGGCELTLATLRQRYWILRGRREVKGVIYACPCCRRIESRPFVAKMAPLPADRIRVTQPFENTGLDIAGPFFTRQGKKVNKNYICLFTCMTTRAVHLEVVSEMTAPRLLQALRRFIARRGKPRVLQSDNFKSFKQLDKDLRQLVSVEMVDNIARELTSHRIQWNFITEYDLRPFATPVADSVQPREHVVQVNTSHVHVVVVHNGRHVDHDSLVLLSVPPRLQL
ncbi:hypothetical protein T11_6981 [Trichinella zimbabwensis]|uniref:Integrase zinc-binding domain-containing protein n=1 Tax=Trichinella zimbabwensis TaxID=268475 RepID=A0A0V1HFK8_9BILA|nr:hypothetical protein T11_6981 [Trichinella zimbabwensis]